MDSTNLAAFKEPKAFIKLLQIVLTIIAFALTTSFSSFSEFNYACQVNETPVTIRVNYSYPFNINETNKIGIICSTPNGEAIIYGNYSSQSQFFVFVGVIAMLYCFAAIILYVFFSEMSFQNDRIPKIDFIITAVIAILWFICSVAWADGVSKLKVYTDPGHIINGINYCMKNSNLCKVLLSGSYGNLNASLIAGFANIALWAANLWFLFKETLWYERRNPSDQIIGNESVDGGNM